MSTYLYIKQHTVTGKLYFGKTAAQHPETYLGSGTHWKRHIQKHGKEHVVNLWYHLFEDQEECTAFALEFSSALNIVESNQWLNQILENGIDGAPIGNPGPMLNKSHSESTKIKISESLVGYKHKSDSKLKMSETHTGKTLNNIHKSKISDSCKGRIFSEEHKLKLRESALNRKSKQILL